MRCEPFGSPRWADWTGPAAAYYYHDRAWLQQPGINFMGRIIYRF